MLTFNQLCGIIWLQEVISMAEIGKNIRRLREKNGLSQEELANRMGYKSKTTINKIEMGVNDIPQNKIERFAQALNTTPAVLLGWAEEEVSADNRVLADLFLQLQSDQELLDMVVQLSEFSKERRQAFKPVFDAYVKAGK
jgi:transcriptional regulator with XRE-family HTH domain